MYELFDHTADLGLLVRAETREQLLLDARIPAGVGEDGPYVFQGRPLDALQESGVPYLRTRVWRRTKTSP